jgi:hypothetical protein
VQLLHRKFPQVKENMYFGSKISFILTVSCKVNVWDLVGKVGIRIYLKKVGATTLEPMVKLAKACSYFCCHTFPTEITERRTQHFIKYNRHVQTSDARFQSYIDITAYV